ncbi:lytic polysaccharide monooxygenase [Streptomyces sp. NPDC127532]|uniref:lytic polysaccharide monooxygenase n=1 Tax=Streptomyces sp. NPDC127532 TaxID=3345399 RepID=UPI003638ECAC
MPHDWNGVNIADAAGRQRELIPDGKLCSAGNGRFRGPDLPVADRPATGMPAGGHAFRFRATAPHKGSFAPCLTRAGYDPAKPLARSDLEEKPFAEATDPKLEGGSYVFRGTVPERSGRQVLAGTGSTSGGSNAYLVMGGTTALAVGAAVLFASVRRRGVSAARHRR